jgi:aspartyl-tRNA(Asn)/glutamyl-tRNA(Gln) amidotransferase subunit C
MAVVDDVGEEECEELAGLARLSVTPAQRRQFATQLGQIVSYLQQLADVDIDGVDEYVPPQLDHAPQRDDVPGPTLPREVILGQAAHARGKHVAVPKFKED